MDIFDENQEEDMNQDHHEKHYKEELKNGEEAYLDHDYKQSNVQGSTFWMSLSDFVKNMYITTICYHDVRHFNSFCQDQIFSYKWGACFVELPHTETDCFASLFQMNDRFMDERVCLDKDYEYAEM